MEVVVLLLIKVSYIIQRQNLGIPYYWLNLILQIFWVENFRFRYDYLNVEGAAGDGVGVNCNNIGLCYD